MGKQISPVILLYGPRKAGTTLLRDLFDGGDYYVLPKELQLNLYVLGLKNWHKKLEELPEGQWAAKEVGGNALYVWGFFCSHFLHVRSVMIKRHPLNIVSSIIRERSRRNVFLGVKDVLREIFQAHRVVNQIAYLGSRDSRISVIQYENLIEEPEKVMRGVCAFLDTPFKPIYLRTTLFGEDRITPTASVCQSGVFVKKRKWNQGIPFRHQAIIYSINKLLEWRSRIILNYEAKNVSYAELGDSPVSSL